MWQLDFSEFETRHGGTWRIGGIAGYWSKLEFGWHVATRFAAYIDRRPELTHIRSRRKSPGQNGVRERAFGSLKYEHLYRHEIDDGHAEMTRMTDLQRRNGNRRIGA